MNSSSVVIITGGARGIGLGIAVCFARKKARIVVADLDQGAATKAAAQLRRKGARAACGLACDVTDRAALEQMVKETVKRYGRIDILVNNAGICPFIDVMKMKPEVWQKTLDVNLTSAFDCTQLVAKQMIKQRQGGRIVFITSLSENVTGPAQVDYAASKAGMR
ncbi:MAG: SDR family oxidoreductase, partial [Planctomycetes bacterium]|nr:SDR family oxidoreductase [Planctomycetota bacterium]